jgi:hypothetical protein
MLLNDVRSVLSSLYLHFLLSLQVIRLVLTHCRSTGTMNVLRICYVLAFKNMSKFLACFMKTTDFE